MVIQWDLMGFKGIYDGIPSGYVKIAIEAMAIDIVDFPIDSMVIFHSYVKLPEGNSSRSNMQNWWVPRQMQTN